MSGSDDWDDHVWREPVWGSDEFDLRAEWDYQRTIASFDDDTPQPPKQPASAPPVPSPVQPTSETENSKEN